MDRLELTTILGELGINVPDKCLVCRRLGKLASTLSLAQENRAFLVASTDTEVLTANIRAQLTSQVREYFPDATEEQVAETVANSADNFLNSDKLPNALKNAGSALEVVDTTIDSTVSQITGLLDWCPPEGCNL